MSDSRWVRHIYRRNKVFVRFREDGQPDLDARGLAVIRYKVQDEREYSVHPGGLIPLTPEAEADLDREKERRTRRTRTLRIFTAVSGAGQGPTGAGILMLGDGYRRQISLFLPRSTLGVAGLVAVREALDRVKDRQRRVRLRVDSAHVLNLLTGDWQARTHPDLVEEIRTLMRSFPDLEVQRGRSKRPDENRLQAARLAAEAVATGRGIDRLSEIGS